MSQKHPLYSFLLISFPLFYRKWVPSATKGKGTTWMTGQFSVGDLCGSARRPSASVTSPPTHYCRWRGSSMDGRSTARGKCTPCWAPVSTACGRPWRASLWSPARTWQAAETTATYTQSSELNVSSLCPIVLSVYHCIPTSVSHMFQQPLISISHHLLTIDHLLRRLCQSMSWIRVQ